MPNKPIANAARLAFKPGCLGHSNWLGRSLHRQLALASMAWCGAEVCMPQPAHQRVDVTQAARAARSVA